MSERYPHLLDKRAIIGPRLIGALITTGSSLIVADNLNSRAAEIAALDLDELPTSVLIQGREMLSPNRKPRLKPDAKLARIVETARNIRAQSFSGELAVAATVDHDTFTVSSKHRTALDDLGVILHPASTNVGHAAAINRGIQDMGMEDGVGVSIAAGNRFATDQALRAASLRMIDGAAGVFGPLVMDRSPSNFAASILSGDSEYYKQEANADSFPSPDENGYMSDAASAFRIATLRKYPLDASYELGGGLRAWGDDLQSEPGHIWYDPSFAVHDSRAHGMSSLELLEEAMREDSL